LKKQKLTHDSKVFIYKFPQANKVIVQIKVIKKCCKVIRRVKGMFKSELESVLRARRTQDHPTVQIYYGCGAYNRRNALYLVRDAHPQRPKTVPNCLQLPVKPLKSTGRLYIMAYSSNLVNVIDPGGSWWPPTKSTWTPIIVLLSIFSFLNCSTTYYF